MATNGRAPSHYNPPRGWFCKIPYYHVGPCPMVPKLWYCIIHPSLWRLRRGY